MAIKTRITPFLWFDDKAEEAVAFYTSIFENSRVIRTVGAASVAADSFDRTAHEPAPAMAAAICVVLVLIVGVLPWPVIEVSDAAAASVMQTTPAPNAGDREPSVVRRR